MGLVWICSLATLPSRGIRRCDGVLVDLDGYNGKKAMRKAIKPEHSSTREAGKPYRLSRKLENAYQLEGTVKVKGEIRIQRCIQSKFVSFHGM
jgi:hypothetical protein